MAIINCPECNEKISNKSKNCIHCGAELTVCPECESLFVGNVEVCSECGFAISEQQTNNEKEKKGTPLFTTARSAETTWKNNNLFIKYKSVVTFALKCLIFILTLSAFSQINSWLTSNVDMLFSYNSTYSNVKDLAMLCLIVGIVLNVYVEVISVIPFSIYSSWIANKGTKLSSIIVNSFSQDFSKMIDEEIKKEAKCIQYAIDTEVIDSDSEYKSKVMLHGIIGAVVDLLDDILIYFFFIKNIEIFMQAELLRSDLLNNPGWSISMVEDWWLLITSGIIFIASCVLEYRFNTNKEKLRKEWVKENMPENLSKFEKYVQDVN